MRAEQTQLRPDTDATITGAVLNEMVYTRQVVKEVLRFRPPAPMVPQVPSLPLMVDHALLQRSEASFGLSRARLRIQPAAVCLP